MPNINSQYNKIVAQATEAKHQPKELQLYGANIIDQRNLTPAQRQRIETIAAMQIIANRKDEDISNVVW